MTDRPTDPAPLDELGPPTLADRGNLVLRSLGMLAASVPTTTVPPILWSLLRYRRFRDEPRLQSTHRMCDWAAFCLRRVLRADVRVWDADRLPADRRRLMFVSNHQSYMDIPTIMGALRIGAFLSKDLVAYIPIIGLTAYLGGTVYIRRGRADSRKRALEDTLRMCEESVPVVVFPEGTRSRTGDLAETIRPGALLACFERRIRVATFALDGTRLIMPPAMDRIRPGQRVAVVVGPTLEPEAYPTGDAFVAAAWNAVRAGHARARSLREDPGWPADGRPPGP